jgi:hypothetical protein
MLLSLLLLLFLFYNLTHTEFSFCALNSVYGFSIDRSTAIFTLLMFSLQQVFLTAWEFKLLKHSNLIGMALVFIYLFIYFTFTNHMVESWPACRLQAYLYLLEVKSSEFPRKYAVIRFIFNQFGFTIVRSIMLYNVQSMKKSSFWNSQKGVCIHIIPEQETKIWRRFFPFTRQTERQPLHF